MREVPTYPQLEAWKLAILESIIACANRPNPEGVTAWWMEVYTKTFEQLGHKHCPRKYMRLDGKVGTGCNKLLKGRLGRKITIKKQQMLRETGCRTLSGRQQFKLILENYRTGQKLGRYFSIIDMEKLEWKGDSVEQMQDFRSNIEDLEAGLNPSVSDAERLDIFLDRMEKSKVLETKLDRFKEYKEGGRKRTKDRLLKIIDDYIEQQTVKKNMKLKSDAIGGKLKGKAEGGLGLVGADGKALTAGAVKSQAVCQKFIRGVCKKSKKDCPYSHPEDLASLAISKGGGGGKGSAKASPDTVCHNCGKKGHFKKDCRHVPFNKPKGEPKGGGKNRGRKGGGSGGSGTETDRTRSRSPMSAEDKAVTYCMHHARGACNMGAACAFSHDDKHKKKPANPKTKAKAKAKTKKALAGLSDTEKSQDEGKSKSAKRRAKKAEKKAAETSKNDGQ